MGVESEHLLLFRAVNHFFDAVGNTYRELMTDYWAKESVDDPEKPIRNKKKWK
ncbi:MAG: hypothetical protein JNM63_15415, partial [Spirochaetia bacterium]|nr:hypothetical protein [Spirochaetia bacterium]